ncbi:MAG: hypothetical protein KUG83_00800 [Gammaproteobacteria bacterium]|nr:hypothetical protein [Gammaproteobacteria bacterium]
MAQIACADLGSREEGNRQEKAPRIKSGAWDAQWQSHLFEFGEFSENALRGSLN